jgi:hypothetical protein
MWPEDIASGFIMDFFMTCFFIAGFFIPIWSEDSFAVTWPPWQKPWRLFAFGSLQVAGNFIEDAIQLGADRGHGGDDHDGYQGSEQCIFDGSSTGLVGEKRRDSMGHDLFLSLLSDVDANRRAIGR